MGFQIYNIKYIKFNYKVLKLIICTIYEISKFKYIFIQNFR